MPDLTLTEALVFEQAMSFAVDLSFLTRRTRRVTTALWNRCRAALAQHGVESWDMFNWSEEEEPPDLVSLTSELSLDEIQALHAAAAHIQDVAWCDPPEQAVFFKLEALTKERLTAEGLPLERNVYRLWGE